jgi:hypothetical protein
MRMQDDMDSNFTRLPAMQVPLDIEPPDALWSRIEQAHVRKRRRRTIARVAGAGMAVAVVAVALTAGGRLISHSRSNVDWEARAQALELQLRTVAEGNGMLRTVASDDMRVELRRVDLSLQSAYDRGAREDELAPLWKRRSELLNTLIEDREHGLALTQL